jgi:hypothetical protein
VHPAASREEAPVPRTSSLRRILIVAMAALTAVACSGPVAAPPAATPAGSTPGPIAVYTLEKPEHRNPAPIVWDAESRTFFVGTMSRSPAIPMPLAARPDVAVYPAGHDAPDARRR